MSEDSRPEQEPQTDSDHQSADHQPYVISEKDVRTFEVTSGFWVAALIAFASLAGVYDHRGTATWLTVAALICGIAFLAAFVLYNRLNKKTIAWNLFVPLAIAHLACLGWAIFLLGSEPPAFRIDHGIPFWVRSFTKPLGPHELTAFALSAGHMLAVEGGPHLIAFPVAGFMYLTLTNISTSARAITEYDLAVAPTASGPWQKLCRLDLQTKSVFFFSDIKKAGRILSEKNLDVELGEQAIGPGDTVGGWTVWACPQISPDECKPTFFRLSLYNSLGSEGEYIIPNTWEAGLHAHNELMKSEMKIEPGTTDLSGVEPAATCKIPGTE